jgi:hypothetical protein
MRQRLRRHQAVLAPVPARRRSAMLIVGDSIGGRLTCAQGPRPA